MLIYEVLKDDHDTIKDLLEELIALPDDSEKRRHELIGQIRDELIPHSRAEESVLYNSLRSIDVAKDLVMHSYKEHMEAEALLRTLQVKDKVDANWRSTAEKLKKALEHHIAEEETRVFNAARRVLTEEEAEMMADAFDQLKAKVQGEGFVKTTLDMIANVMPPRFMDQFRSSAPQHHQR